MGNILVAIIFFAIISGVLGLILAFASGFFAVEVNEKAEEIQELLPGANCGECGYICCASFAEAVSEGKVSINKCSLISNEKLEEISKIIGIESYTDVKRMRAQVMCSGTHELAAKKYIYAGISDCMSASKLSGGDKLCPNGCIGLGTCIAACKFDAIHIINGVAAVDYEKCIACGLCVTSCPKNIIKLIPYDAKHWVGCSSSDKGSITKSYCDVGCIGCKLCEKACPNGAIKFNGNIAEINYELCTGCGLCESKCPRKIIWSARSQEEEGIIRLKQNLTSTSQE